MKNSKLVDKNKLMKSKVKKNTMKNTMSIRKKRLTKMKRMLLRKINKKDKMTDNQKKKKKSLSNQKKEETRLTL